MSHKRFIAIALIASCVLTAIVTCGMHESKRKMNTKHLGNVHRVTPNATKHFISIKFIVTNNGVIINRVNAALVPCVLSHSNLRMSLVNA